MSKAGREEIRLGVNIDHVATIRNARGTEYPSPVFAAKIAEKAGADGITAHLREDRRHINDIDIRTLRQEICIPLNLEMAATTEMSLIAVQTKPNSVCLVPERREELTTEGGLDVVKDHIRLGEFIKPLKECGSRISFFIEANESQIRSARDLGADIVEIHVGKYCDLLEGKEFDLAKREFERHVNMAQLAHESGLEVHLGHGITYDSARNLSTIEWVREMNIGHFLIGQSIFYGISNVIKKMKQAIKS